ncbi:MAG: hypothetical protein ACP5N2_01215 [Candidatus Nanoarchaeia archaeon]
MGELTHKWVELLIPVTSNYYRKYTGTELSILSGVPQQSASRHLISLTNSSVLECEKQGANKLFYLDKTKPSTKMLLEILENSKALNFNEKNQVLVQKIKEINSSNSFLVLSSKTYLVDKKVSSGSEITLFIIGFESQKTKNAKEKTKITESKINKIKIEGYRVNQYFITSEEFSRLLKNKTELSNQILENHIMLGDVSSAVRLFSEVLR